MIQINTTESRDLYAIITTSDGAECFVTTEADLKRDVHQQLCTCDKGWEHCETDVARSLIRTLDDENYWTHPYPQRKRFQWYHEFEDGSIQVNRLTRPMGVLIEAGRAS